MPRAHAVRDADGRLLFQTEGFYLAKATVEANFESGCKLLVSGEDAARAQLLSLQKELDEALAANSAKEVFLSNMSHDIRTPMNAIVGMTVLAKKHIDEKPRVQDALNKIETASSHLLGLINDVLDMSRINSGRMQLNSELFSLSDLLHDLMIIVRPLMEGKGHTCHLRCEQVEAESFYGDALRLRQIYVNIISNAVKYTPDGGMIDLLFSQRIDGTLCHLTFQCRDNGIGMSEDFLQRIFEPFERVHNSTVSRIEGTGLGMSIVRKMVSAMQGKIEIESKEGSGTSVTITIPLPYDSKQPDAAHLVGKRILLVESDPSLKEDYQRYLAPEGIILRVADTAAEAVAATTDSSVRGELFDLVILGHTQRDTRGVLDLAAYLHQAEPSLQLALASEDDWEKLEYPANRSGISHFIPLPFFRKTLVETIGSIFQAHSEGNGGSEEIPDLSGKRILLVEDNLINCEIAKEILLSTGAAVDSAENGKQAVDLFAGSAAGTYQLILMDVQMPVMNGYEATAAIRSGSHPDAARIPIYAMTANTFAEDIARALQSGMNGHLAKPIDIQVLMQLLRKI